jgi:hypothetical protein
MTSPTPETPLLTRFIELSYRWRPWADATVAVPVSRGDDQIWITVPFDTDITDPDGMHSPGGWSILKAPDGRGLYYDLTAFLMVQGGVASYATHLQFYTARALLAGETDGVDNIVAKRQAAEWPILERESHGTGDTVWYSNTHQFVPAQGYLAAGLRLRVRTDYWSAPVDAPELRICGAGVSGFWGYAPA